MNEYRYVHRIESTVCMFEVESLKTSCHSYLELVCYLWYNVLSNIICCMQSAQLSQMQWLECMQITIELSELSPYEEALHDGN